MGHLYGRKGFAELHLNKPTAIDSFKKALLYNDILDQPRLSDLLIRILKERYDIELIRA